VPDGNMLHGAEARALDRRQALRRGVLIGTAPVWTTPLVQAITISPASAQTTSPPPPTTPPTDPPGPVKEISNIQVIVRSAGVLYGLKWDGSWEAWSAAAPDANDCIRYHADGVTVVADDSVAEAFAAAVTVEVVDAYHWRIALPLPSGYELVAGYSKAGDARKVGCAPAVVSATSVDFPGGPG
jgi:hypothetical protein